mmetsp:Transcript_28387/g.72945  ORF Transcript_28387/g.72945 Transcript_28387/m.72945 type:complete len:156 (-) Transcript_28387:264-731(-)
MHKTAGPPFHKAPETGVLTDGSGEEVRLMGSSRRILAELATDPKWEDTAVAYVSRTMRPEWAGQCLRLIDVTEGLAAVSMDELGEHKEIYRGKKTAHFQRIHEQSGIDYKDMIFFDNERRNIEDVQQLGVTCVHTPDGMTDQAWEVGLRQFVADR